MKKKQILKFIYNNDHRLIENTYKNYFDLIFKLKYVVIT